MTTNSVNTYIVTTANREVTKPSQPAFLAYLPAFEANATGDGTAFTLGSVIALGKAFDQNNDFNVNGTLTAPVTGRYRLFGAASLQNIGAAHTTGDISIVTSNGTYSIARANIAGLRAAPNYYHGNGGVLCDMDATDTATVVTTVSGGAQTVGLGSAAINRFGCFSGNLEV